MTIKNNCLKGKLALPTLPCTERQCPWFVRDTDFCCCFWMVADFMEEFKFDGFTDEEIAKILDISVDEVERIADEAIKNIRVSLRKQLISLE